MLVFIISKMINTSKLGEAYKLLQAEGGCWTVRILLPPPRLNNKTGVRLVVGLSSSDVSLIAGSTCCKGLISWSKLPFWNSCSLLCKKKNKINLRICRTLIKATCVNGFRKNTLRNKITWVSYPSQESRESQQSWWPGQRLEWETWSREKDLLDGFWKGCGSFLRWWPRSVGYGYWIGSC